MDATLSQVVQGEPLAHAEALALAGADRAGVRELMQAAAALRDRTWGGTLTFSPKVFLPLTNICRNRCDYCSFRKSPGDAGAWTMNHGEVHEWMARAAALGCVEALLCLGDKPEGAFGAYRRELDGLGHDSTVDYLDWACQHGLELGMLPHTNAGVLTKGEMERLRPSNVSLGLMLENISERLCEKGMPHHRAPDKRPAVRVQMIREAGELRIPFTTGILLGIGETLQERVASLLAIRDLHAEHGHIQEVIVQNFAARPEIPMAHAPEPEDWEMAHAVAMARLILPAEVSIQAPPNLNPTRTRLLVEAGINDFGGISPVSPDYINPLNPWPLLGELWDACEQLGFALRPRLPIYPRYLAEPGWVDPCLRDAITKQESRLQGVERVDQLVPPAAMTDERRSLPLERSL